MMDCNIGSIVALSLLIASGSSVAVAASPDLGVPPRPADTIMIHGKVITVDASDSIGQAIAIRNGKIAAVGTDQQIAALAGPHTRTIDLRGRTVTPGLIDTHAHVAQDGYEEVYGVPLQGVTSIAQAVELVKSRVAQLKPGEWVHGGGWDEGKLAERRYITAADLDAVSPNNPVWLVHTTVHYGVANSYALRLAKVSAATSNPPAGTIDRDPNAAPTGVLKEAAMNLVTELIPPPPPEHQRNAILKVISRLHSEGMTAVKDPWIDRSMWDAYVALLDAGELTAHVCVLWQSGATLESAKKTLQQIQSLPTPPHSLGNGRLLSCGAKLFMDGSGGARTAWVYKDWNKNSTEVDQGNVGYPAEDPAVFRQQVRLFHQAGVHIGTHAIGDRAIDMVVDTYAEVLKETPTVGLRHSVIHANIPTDHAIDTMSALQKKYDAGYPEVQPEFTWWIGDLYAGNFGTARGLRVLPLKTYEERGVQWAGGSDYDVTPLPARLGLWAAAERETMNGSFGRHPFGIAEAVDIHSALRAYTRIAARQLFLENQIGSIEVGKDADLAVWTQDLYAIPSRELKNLSCEMTVFNGQIVFHAK